MALKPTAKLVADRRWRTTYQEWGRPGLVGLVAARQVNAAMNVGSSLVQEMWPILEELRESLSKDRL